MEVTKNDFRWQLNHMLRALSISHFCAVDFEFSGIPSKSTHRAKTTDGGPGGSRQTLQERYQETKDAANKYQILQVGFTVAREEPAKGPDSTIHPVPVFLADYCKAPMSFVPTTCI
jgi:poly(A)-specific ribonuclease